MDTGNWSLALTLASNRRTGQNEHEALEQALGLHERQDQNKGVYKGLKSVGFVDDPPIPKRMFWRVT
eukprot:334352-Pelagomonas_calceolata.AAC.2